MRALLLEDDPDRGTFIRDLLRQHGYQVTWVRSFEEARTAWKRCTYDLAALDHDLGPTHIFGTGRMFTRWVIMQPNVCATAFIVHSANIIDAPHMVQDLASAGCEVARVWPDSIGKYLQMVAPQPPAKRSS